METETRTEGWGREDDNYLLLLIILENLTHQEIFRLLIGSGCAISRGIIFVNRKWRLKVANSFGFDWRSFDDIIPRGEPGGRDRRV